MRRATAQPSSLAHVCGVGSWNTRDQTTSARRVARPDVVGLYAHKEYARTCERELSDEPEWNMGILGAFVHWKVDRESGTELVGN